MHIRRDEREREAKPHYYHYYERDKINRIENSEIASSSLYHLIRYYFGKRRYADVCEKLSLFDNNKLPEIFNICICCAIILICFSLFWSNATCVRETKNCHIWNINNKIFCCNLPQFDDKWNWDFHVVRLYFLSNFYEIFWGDDIKLLFQYLKSRG